MEFDEVSPALEAIAMAAASEQATSPEALAAQLDIQVDSVAMICHALETAGFVMFAPKEEPDAPPLMLEAGRQYLRLKGKVDRDALFFLPSVIDDLHARQALVHAGTVLVDEFRYAFLHDRGPEHAAELIPPAFAKIVDEGLALDLFAACVGLIARLSAGQAAGCLAEEIMAVQLLENAAAWLEMRQDMGEISDEESDAATGALRGIFELFQDDDVLNLFDMEEPADAAVTGHSYVNQQMGVADQRPESWFRPFGGVPHTGHLAER